jgi:hypothetical protein
VAHLAEQGRPCAALHQKSARTKTASGLRAGKCRQQHQIVAVAQVFGLSLPLLVTSDRAVSTYMTQKRVLYLAPSGRCNYVHLS